MSHQFIPPKLPAVPLQSFWKQVVLGLSLIWGTGAFIGIAIAADVAASGVLWALTLAALIALGNAWNEVQQGITPVDSAYPPAYHPAWLQFAADSTLFLAKLTSAATAALGLAGYFLNGLHQTDPMWIAPTALIAIIGLTLVTLRRPPNPKFPLPLIVAAVALLGLILAGLPVAIRLSNSEVVAPTTDTSSPLEIASLLQATALMAAAYTGYEGWMPRQALQAAKQTLAAISIAVSLTWLLYLGVAFVGISAVGASVFGSAVIAHAAPLITVMQTLALPGGVYLIAIAGVVALTCMLLRLLPQLTNQLIKLNQALNRPGFAPNDEVATNLAPVLSLKWISVALSCILLVGDVKILWSFSAFAFLIHAALMHWIALRYPLQPNLYPSWLSWIGFATCLFLAFWVDWSVWLVGLGGVALALVWRGMMHWSQQE